MYLENRFENIDNRPVITTLYGICIPQYPYKVSELPQELAGIESSDVFYDIYDTVESAIDRQRAAFKEQIEQQQLKAKAADERLRECMVAFEGSCGGCGCFQYDFEVYRATQLHNRALGALVSRHILSAMLSVFVLAADKEHFYYINEGLDDSDTAAERCYKIDGSQHIIDITASLFDEMKRQGLAKGAQAFKEVATILSTDELADLVSRTLWGLSSDQCSVVIKRVQTAAEYTA